MSTMTYDFAEEKRRVEMPEPQITDSEEGKDKPKLRQGTQAQKAEKSKTS